MSAFPTPRPPVPPTGVAWLRAVITVLLAVLVLYRGTAGLQALAPDDTATLARASAAAVRGVVESLRARHDPATGAIYTHVGIAVTRAWGFAAPPAQLELTLLGGVAGNEALFVGEQARFAVGEDVFAFLDVRPRDGTLSVTGLERGKWTMQAHRAIRQREGRASIAIDPAELETWAALTGTLARVPPGAGRLSASGAADVSTTDASAPLSARWHEADWGAAVPVDSAYDGHPLFPSGGLNQFLRAMTAWSQAGPLQLVPGLARAPRCFANDEPADGRITVSYDDPCGEIADTSPIIAIGGAYYSTSDLRDIGGTPYGKITKGMVVLDNVLTKFAGMSTGCYEEVLTHELGHALGLGHSAVTPAVMAPTLSPVCVDRTESLPLQPADRAALAVPYPAPMTSGPPAAPGGLSAVVVGGTVTLHWSPAAGAAPAGYQLQAGSLPGLADYGAAATSLTTFTASHVAVGVYYLRVIAVNAAGASASSSEIAVVVGSGLPAAPVGLVAAAGGAGRVRVFWHPAAGAVPTGYLLLAGHGRDTIDARVPLGAPALAAEDIAPGTYYVRVAALNATGLGPASDVITIVVP